MKPMHLKKVADYLYYMELKDYTFLTMPEADSPQFTVGCSSVRKGNLYGRNLDLGYCETPEFIIRLYAAEDRLASIALCAEPSVTCAVGEIPEAELLAMPNVTNDGINENGVVINVNVVKATGVDDLSGTAPGKENLHASRVVRYLLDRAESAQHAVELMRRVNIVGGFSGYALHWMIADEKDTFVVEIINGALVVSRNEKYYMTNFYLNYGPVQKEQVIAETRFENVPLLNEYAIGVERWCVLRDGYDKITSADDMMKLLASVRATAMYDRTKKPAWYSECTGGALSIHSSRAEFERVLEKQLECFDARDRKNPQGDWNTWHSSVYDIADRSLCVYSQEDYSVGYHYRLNDE